MDINEIRNNVSETIENVRLEYKRLKKRRKPVFPYIIGIAFLVLIIVSMGQINTDNQSRIRQLEQRQIKTYQELKSELDQLKKDKKIKDDEYQKRLNELQAKKDTKIRVASVQPTRSRPVQRVGSSGNCEQYRPLVAQYSWNVETALAVMRAESGCNSMAANWTDRHATCKGSFGLFQIACMDGQVFDPAQNVAIAYRKYQSRGWQPWTVCRTVVRCV